MTDRAQDARDYLDIQKTIKVLEEQALTIRERLKADLLREEPPEGGWQFEGAQVQYVKGRQTRRLNRSKLVRQGVSADILNRATDVVDSPPTIRIVPPGEPPDGVVED